MCLAYFSLNALPGGLTDNPADNPQFSRWVPGCWSPSWAILGSSRARLYTRVDESVCGYRINQEQLIVKITEQLGDWDLSHKVFISGRIWTL